MADTARGRTMGPTQLIAWLVCLMLSFVAILLALMSMYSTRMLSDDVKEARDELEASRAWRGEQNELLRDIRDLLGGEGADASVSEPFEGS